MKDKKICKDKKINIFDFTYVIDKDGEMIPFKKGIKVY